MTINWKVRFKNKTWLLMFVLAIIGFVYQILEMLNIVPPVSQDQFVKVVASVIDFLVLIGVLVDPTTAGASDSERAMNYTVPGGIEEESDGD